MNDNQVFQSKEETVLEDLSQRLYQPGVEWNGFDRLEKAANPALASRRELHMGHLSDEELAHELALLDEYLRNERELYPRRSLFHSLMDGAVQRIRHLSGRLATAEAKPVEEQTNKQFVGRLSRPPAVVSGFPEDPVHAQFIPADGAPIETVVSYPVTGIESVADVSKPYFNQKLNDFCVTFDAQKQHIRESSILFLEYDSVGHYIIRLSNVMKMTGENTIRDLFMSVVQATPELPLDIIDNAFRMFDQEFYSNSLTFMAAAQPFKQFVQVVKPMPGDLQYD